MILNKVVTNGPAIKMPEHLSLGEYFLERILNNCERKGDSVALINGNTDEQSKYSELAQETVNIAVGLKALGLKRGDVVAFYVESRNEVVSGVMGAICAGAVVTIFNTLYTKEELEHVLNISKPRIIFCSATALRVHINVLKDTRSIEHIVQINDDPITDDVQALDQVSGYSDPKNFKAETISSTGDTVVILYSSGTTGLPKGVMLTHCNIIYMWALLDRGYYGVQTSHTFLTLLPFYHVFGLIMTLHCLTCHKQVIYTSGFNPEKYLSIIQDYKVDCLFVVPPVIVYMAKSAIVENYDVSSIKAVWSGAAPLSLKTASDMAKRFPNFAKLIQGYGMTEATLAVLLEKDELDAEPGLLPIPGCEVKVVDIVTREKLGPNEQGEICFKSPGTMKGYVDDETATKAMFDEEGYLKTGDIGYYDEKGCFSIIDRLKEIIKYKGHQVAPAAIESVILQHSSVADCGVVGRPDEVAFELPTAFVALKPGARLTEEELLEYTNAKVSPLARLRGGVIFVDEIPKSPSGKILRRVLKQRLLALD